MSTDPARSRGQASPSRLRPFLFWLLLLVIAGAAAFFSRAVWGKAVFFFVLFLPFLSLLPALPVRRRLSVSFSFPVSASKMRPVRGRVTLHNGSRFACRRIFVRISVQNRLTGERSETGVYLAAPARGSSDAVFSFSSEHCGMMTFSVRRAALFDWFGFLSIPAEVTAEQGVLLLPDTFPAEVSVSMPFSETGDTESYSRHRGTEDPTEVYALRGYRPGDPVRRIHWKLSAKREMPIFKEISMPVSRTLLLYWDKSAAPADTADALAESFSSVSLSLAAQGIPFTLGWHDEAGEHMELITDEAAALAAVPLCVRNGAGSGSAQAESAAGYAKVLWFADRYPFSAEPFLPPDTVCFLCSEKPLEAGSRFTVCYAPEEAASFFAVIRI